MKPLFAQKSLLVDFVKFCCRHVTDGNVTYNFLNPAEDAAVSTGRQRKHVKPTGLFLSHVNFVKICSLY